MANKRTFDWGPPAQKGDSFKEILMYFFIGVLFFGGMYLLIDVDKKTSYVAMDEKNEEAEQNAPSYSTAYSKGVGLDKYSRQNKIPGTEEAPPVEITYNSEKASKKLTQDKTRYFVQMGAFSDEASATEVFNMLKQTGSDPILKAPDDRNPVFRVLIGPFYSEADADYKAEKLNELDLPCFVVEQ